MWCDCTVPHHLGLDLQQHLLVGRVRPDMLAKVDQRRPAARVDRLQRERDLMIRAIPTELQSMIATWAMGGS